jgi:replicative DNA helicase
LSNELRQRIKDGLDGKFEGLFNGFNRINRYIFNIQRKCITTVGAASGAGKTTLVDFMLFNAIDDAIQKDIDLNIIYFSYEIDEVTKKCNFLSSYIYRKHGVIIPPEKIKGLGKNRLTNSEIELIKTELPFVDELFNKITFVFDNKNPNEAFSYVKKKLASKGKVLFKNEKYFDEESGKVESMNTPYRFEYYNPNTYTIVVTDHIALFDLLENNLKHTIDTWSKHCVTLKNFYEASIFNIQQFNDGLTTVERQKFKGVDLSPQQSDFKDSRNTYNDSDVVIGLMNPYKMGLKECMKLLVEKLPSMLMFKIIKNRLSKDNVVVMLNFIPQAGTFEELPKSHEFIDNPDLYESYNSKIKID